MKFCTNGIKPPPTTIIMKIPEAWAVYLPRPSVARLKILGHMIEVQRPQSTKNMAEIGTVTNWNEEPVNTGISTVVDLPRSTAKRMNSIPAPLATIIIERLETLLAMKLEHKRPTNMSNQYVPATKPPIAAAFAKAAPLMKPPPLAVVSEM